MRTLCCLEDIADGDARGFDLDDPDSAGFFVVRQGDQVFGYVNDCPHWRVSLDFVPGRFMNLTKGMIQCSNHGARFRIEDGMCEWGPCIGDSLTALTVRVIDGTICLIEPDSGSGEA